MIACLDVAYEDRLAHAAGITAKDWTDAHPLEERVVQVSNVLAYEPGQFFRRELPCLLAILKALPPVEAVIIDGYVWLGGNQPGLGAHLYEALGKQTSVVGVAKTRFKGAGLACEILRGMSTRPLFITAAGMGAERAAEHVRLMHGRYRTPTLLKRVDELARKAQSTTLSA